MLPQTDEYVCYIFCIHYIRVRLYLQGLTELLRADMLMGGLAKSTQQLQADTRARTEAEEKSENTKQSIQAAGIICIYSVAKCEGLWEAQEKLK